MPRKQSQRTVDAIRHFVEPAGDRVLGPGYSLYSCTVESKGIACGLKLVDHDKNGCVGRVSHLQCHHKDIFKSLPQKADYNKRGKEKRPREEPDEEQAEAHKTQEERQATPKPTQQRFTSAEVVDFLARNFLPHIIGEDKLFALERFAEMGRS